MLANIYVGEFGFGRRDESQKRGSSAFRERVRVLRAAINKPISSLESCLISYEISDGSCISCERRRQRPLLVTDGSKIVSRGAGISPLLLPIPITDCGLPCHNDINSDEPGPVPITGLPFLRKCSQSSRNAGMTKRRKTCRYNTSTLSTLESNKHLPLQDTSAGYHLVCFGVGIGIISTIMSSRREMQRLTCLLRQKEELVEDLKEVLETQGSWTVKDVTDEARNCFESWQHALGKEQRQSDASLDALSNKACEADERTSGRDPVRKMENMTSVEAELEAELEKLEFNLHSSKHQRKFLGINEIDRDCIADVVNGELREDGLTRNAESEEDNSSSMHDEFYTGNLSVSPQDLERRLHEVITSRLQDRIVKLETELEVSQTALQALKLAQKQANELNQTSQSLNSDLEVLARTSGYLKSQICFPANTIYHQPRQTTSDVASDSTCPQTPPQVLCNQPDSFASPAEVTCAINGNEILVGSACKLESSVRNQRVVYGGEEADKDIQNLETRSSKILNSSSNSANPNALTKDENSCKDSSLRKLNPRKPRKRGQIRSGLDFDCSVETSTLNVVRPGLDKEASTDCISACHASVTCSEMDGGHFDFADIPIIDPELDKFMSDFLMDFEPGSEELGSVTTLLDQSDDISKLLAENQSCGNAIQTSVNFDSHLSKLL